MLDLIHLMKWRFDFPIKSVTKLLISCLNLLERNFLNLWLCLVSFDYGESVNIEAKFGSAEDRAAALSSSLTKSLFFYRKPITVYSISFGECLMRNIVDGRLKLLVGNLGCFLCLCLSLVIKLESSGDATEHH